MLRREAGHILPVAFQLACNYMNKIATERVVEIRMGLKLGITCCHLKEYRLMTVVGLYIVLLPNIRLCYSNTCFTFFYHTLKVLY